MTSSRLNPKAMVKTISNLTGLHPKGVAHLESMRSASLERGLIPPCLLVILVLVLLLALPLILHLVSFLCQFTLSDLSDASPWHGNPAHLTTGHPTLYMPMCSV